jgi:hypothetical protein
MFLALRQNVCVFALAALVTLSAATPAGCLNAPSVDERIHQQIVVTKFDPNADFGGFATFSITDHIPIRTSLDGGPTGEAGTTGYLDPQVAGPTIDAIASLMKSRGYAEVDHTARPDLGIGVTLVLKLNVAVATGDWWYGDPSVSPSYWGLPGATFAAVWTYDTAAWIGGTLVIDVFDIREAASRPFTQEATLGSMAPAVQIDDVWAAFIHGVVLPNPAEPLLAPPIAPIEQAFAQSPYFHRAPAGEGTL